MLTPERTFASVRWRVCLLDNEKELTAVCLLVVESHGEWCLEAHGPTLG